MEIDPVNQVIPFRVFAQFSLEVWFLVEGLLLADFSGERGAKTGEEKCQNHTTTPRSTA
jgi:hypothetical protein